MDINGLVGKMTVEEKTAQLCCAYRNKPVKNIMKEFTPEMRGAWGHFSPVTSGLPAREAAEMWNRIQGAVIARSRHRIPAILHGELLHGLLANGATIYPQAIGMSCSWDPSLTARVATATARESRSRGVVQALSPVLNLTRDPRCGRTEETFGEDPLLVSRFGVAFIRAVQAQGIACTAKHFAANFVGDGGRDSHDIHYSELEMRESYFPAFEAAVREAGVMSFMPAYNTLNGVPCNSNRWLLVDVLKKEWGLDGFTGSDYSAVINQWKMQFCASGMADAARRSIVGGLDVEWPDGACYRKLPGEVRAGRVPRKVLDESVRRVLRVKEKVGLFANPYANPSLAGALSDSPGQRALAREAARKTFVLLKNNGILPLPKSVKRLAVIGPNAAVMQTGGYSGWGVRLVSPLEGIRNRFGKSVEVVYEEGCSLAGDSRRGLKKAVALARRADAVVLVVGGNSAGSWVEKFHTEGEGRDRCDLNLMGLQEELIKEVSAVNRRTAVVIVNGSAVVMEGWADRVGAILEAWYPGEEGGNAIAEALAGDFSPSGKLTMTFPRATGVLPYYYNIKPTGRLYDYNDLRGTLHRYPFGHGLSYTRFDYRRFRARAEGEAIRVQGEVRNAGKVRGAEVVQLYVHDCLASMTRPLKELKGFTRMELAPGETRAVDLAVQRGDLSFLNSRLKKVFEPGAFEVMVGSSSEDIRYRAQVVLK